MFEIRINFFLSFFFDLLYRGTEERDAICALVLLVDSVTVVVVVAVSVPVVCFVGLVIRYCSHGRYFSWPVFYVVLCYCAFFLTLSLSLSASALLLILSNLEFCPSCKTLHSANANTNTNTWSNAFGATLPLLLERKRGRKVSEEM